jgi:hypothetical protein
MEGHVVFDLFCCIERISSIGDNDNYDKIISPIIIIIIIIITEAAKQRSRPFLQHTKQSRCRNSSVSCRT